MDNSQGIVPSLHLEQQPNRKVWLTGLVMLALISFSLVFALLDEAYLRFVALVFPIETTSTQSATIWGVVTRLHVAIPVLLLILWKPYFFGLQMSKVRQHWRLLLLILVLNCGVIAAYLWLTGGGTPYSDNQWLLTEVVTVPFVEEIMWRGVVFAVLLFVLRKIHTEQTSNQLTIWLAGIAFGLLHSKNILAGVPASFVAVQTLNAVIWGVVYGYSRAKTESVFPAIFFHAAMNLVVVLF